MTEVIDGVWSPTCSTFWATASANGDKADKSSASKEDSVMLGKVQGQVYSTVIQFLKILKYRIYSGWVSF